VLADLAGAGAALALAELGGAVALRPAALALLPLAALASRGLGLGRDAALRVRSSTLDEAPRVFELASLCALVLVLAQDVAVDGALTARALAAIWLGLLAWTLAARWLARRVAERLTAPERVLIVGDDGAAARIAQRLDYQGGGTHVVGRLRPHDARLGDGSPLGFTTLARVVGELGAERMIIVPGAEQRAIDLIRAAKALGVRVSVSPRTLEVIGGNATSENLYGTGLLTVPALELPRSASALKRALDLAGAGLALALLAPLMLAIAGAIVLDTRGPVLFRQERVGRDGRRFQILKFRTMVDGAEAMKAALAERNETQGLFKIARDPRVTRAGRLLRSSSLDELPQLLNVLRGEMSLVGPRPLEVGEDEQIVGWDRRRLVLTPGMTGPWQILGGGRVPLDEMVKIDYRYVAGWSLWEDVKILLRTVPHVLARRAV